MAEKQVEYKKNGMGLLDWLTVIFIVLKFNPGGHLDSPVQDWSWWWVLSPTLIPLGIVLLLFVLGGIALGVAKIFDARETKRRRKERWERLYGKSK